MLFMKSTMGFGGIVPSVLSMLALTACATSSSPPAPVPADIAWVAEGEFCEPETVLSLPDDTLLVSNVCDFRSIDDGFLSLLDHQGNVLNWRAVDNLDSPLGMTLHQDELHIIDANRVSSFTWPGFKTIRDIPLQTKVANDITAAPDGTLYISDTAAGQVIKLAPDGQQQVLTTAVRFTGANGIEFGPDNKLYVGGERLWQVDLETKQAKIFGPEWLTDIDGIEFEPNGIIQVTPVGGSLVRLFKDGSAQIISGEGVSSANHGFAEKAGLVLIPTGYDNSVIAIRLP
jgi:hypothetical protein